MNELEAILALAATVQSKGTTSSDTPIPGKHTMEAMAMATLVKVEGSAYRRPGARMLMTVSGRRSGMISGGCLESDVQERALQVIASGEARIITYDSTAPDDIVFGLGLGCNGIVQVLIEPIPPDDKEGLLAFLADCCGRRKTGRIATVIHTDNVSPANEIAIGTRLLQWPNGRITSNSHSNNRNNCADAAWIAALEAALSRDADTSAGRSERTIVQRVELEEASVEILLETMSPSVPLLVFGAGDDVIPVTHFAKLLGWHVTVIDGRPAYTLPERFPTADSVLCLRPETLQTCPPAWLSPDSLAIVMTHNYTQDKDLLRALLGHDLRYLGILGPKARTQRLLEELAREGSVFAEERLARLHGPAGLDIGAETPEEIALSLLAEMQAVLASRMGGPLWQRTRGIHDTAEQ